MVFGSVMPRPARWLALVHVRLQFFWWSVQRWFNDNADATRVMWVLFRRNNPPFSTILNGADLRCRRCGLVTLGAEGVKGFEAPRVGCAQAHGWRKSERDVSGARCDRGGVMGRFGAEGAARAVAMCWRWKSVNLAMSLPSVLAWVLYLMHWY
jgi:hypothetical protein